jgi:iron complex outermembrane recepter protein
MTKHLSLSRRLLLATLLFATLVLPPRIPLFAQEADSIRIYHLDPVQVDAPRAAFAMGEFPVEKDGLASVLENAGMVVIRKGGFLAQDVYAGGFKRGDIPIVIDGERYHTACPMRMDAPISRINPLEISGITLGGGAGLLQSGLGGIVSVSRSRPERDFHLATAMSQTLGRSLGNDLAVMADYGRQRLSLRNALGEPFRSGEGEDYVSLYGYRENSAYRLHEAAFSGGAGEWEYTASFMYSADILFPYLLMDERNSAVYNASASWRGHKLYVNITDHMMNNDLRLSPMHMQTDVRNSTVGYVSDNAEVYYRHWNADNVLVNPSTTLRNNMLPDVSLLAVSGIHEWMFGSMTLSARLGAAWYHAGNEDALALPRELHGSAESRRLFATGALQLTHRLPVGSELVWGNSLGLISEAPEAEALYVNVRRFPGKPYWSGNPTLDQPLRLRLHTSLIWRDLQFEGDLSHVTNYGAPAGRQIDTQKYQTFENADAMLAHVSLQLHGDLLRGRLDWTWGENRSRRTPLVEIAPLAFRIQLRTPAWRGHRVWIAHTWEDVQRRVDPTLLESASGAWHRLDLGFGGEWSGLGYSFEVENLLDHRYSRHLSYTRDPFSSGFHVLEPGTTFRVQVRYRR